MVAVQLLVKVDGQDKACVMTFDRLARFNRQFDENDAVVSLTDDLGKCLSFNRNDFVAVEGVIKYFPSSS